MVRVGARGDNPCRENVDRSVQVAVNLKPASIAAVGFGPAQVFAAMSPAATQTVYETIASFSLAPPWRWRNPERLIALVDPTSAQRERSPARSGTR